MAIVIGFVKKAHDKSKPTGGMDFDDAVRRSMLVKPEKKQLKPKVEKSKR